VTSFNPAKLGVLLTILRQIILRHVDAKRKGKRKARDILFGLAYGTPCCFLGEVD